MGAGSSVRNIYLVISQGCNIACSYCYAKGGDFGKGQILMSRITMEKALERLLPLSEKRCNISFFGGEPLLNFNLMKKTVAYGKQLLEKQGMELIYAITTNGTIFDEEIIAFFKEYITYTAVSLDGDHLVNDLHRRLNDGSGIHALIMKNLKKLKEAGLSFGISATVSPETVPELKRTVEYLNCIGASNIRVVPVIPQKDQKWEIDAFNHLLEGLKAVNIESIHRVFEGRKPLLAEHIYKVVSNVADSKKRTHPCAAGDEILAVAADGDVYPCHYFVGIEGFYMGNVFTDDFPGKWFYEVKKRISDNSVENRKRCRGCFAKVICGGECHARSFMLTGDISTPTSDHCSLIKEMVRNITPIVSDGIKSEEKRERLFKFIGKIP